MIADISFHDLDGHNPHAHVMLTLREITPKDFGNTNRSWNEHDLMDEWRPSWLRMSNRALERAGSSNRMDHYSLAAQREEAIILAKAALETGRKERILPMNNWLRLSNLIALLFHVSTAVHGIPEKPRR